ENLTGPLEGMPLSALIENMTAGNTYANVHTVQNPGGEIRGQIKTAVSVTPTFNISGFKLDNSTGMGLANWNITLAKPDGTVMNNITDSSGMYRFMNLPNGTYTVAEQMQQGWMNVSAMTMTVTINGSDMMNQNFTNTITTQQPNVTSFELIPDKTAALNRSTITITVKALNVNVTDTNFNGMANI
ncbi:MAG: CHRD domain-containing protein, partial [Candidatus Methanoperedens sp.]|nr:CHRD domain-containing protein [Candidatus Methanoperedens sp.]